MRTVLLLFALLGLAGPAFAQQQNDPTWLEPFPPFRIADNLYYVGSKGLANYLITTPQGHILINSDLEANVPLIRASIEKLGFKFSDIKILLINQGHWDHDAGSAAIKKLTGAQYMVMDADVSVVESGGKTDFHYGNDPSTHYPPVKVDRILHDGDRVTLGGSGADRASHARPHQGLHDVDPASERRRQDAERGDHRRHGGQPGVQAVRQRAVSADRDRLRARVQEAEVAPLRHPPRRARRLLRHGSEVSEDDQAGDKTAFIDPEGYQKYVAAAEKSFLAELAKQKASR